MATTNGQYMPEMGKKSLGEILVSKRRTNSMGVQAEDTRICVVMVGLPARGKSLIAQKGTTSERSDATIYLIHTWS
jgi:6-phosphofructo-2-kinase / fructose-2,6-biphosphatase 2